MVFAVSISLSPNIFILNLNEILVCPPQLVPVPGDNGSQYRYCSPSAPINDGVQGCGTNRHCQFSTNLERYICCGLESDVRLPSK